MVEPATDRQIGTFKAILAGHPTSAGMYFGVDQIQSLIARIHTETEARKAADELCRSIRYNTIQECAALVAEGFDRGISKKADTCAHGRYGWEDCEQCASKAILALLEKKP